MGDKLTFYLLKQLNFINDDARNWLGRIVKEYDSPVANSVPLNPLKFLPSPQYFHQTTISDATTLLRGSSSKKFKSVLADVLGGSYEKEGAQTSEIKTKRLIRWRVRNDEEVLAKLLADEVVKTRVSNWLSVMGQPVYFVVGVLVADDIDSTATSTSTHTLSGSIDVPIIDIATAAAGVPLPVSLGGVSFEKEGKKKTDFELKGKSEGSQIFAMEYKMLKRRLFSVSGRIEDKGYGPTFESALLAPRMRLQITPLSAESGVADYVSSSTVSPTSKTYDGDDFTPIGGGLSTDVQVDHVGMRSDADQKRLEAMQANFTETIKTLSDSGQKYDELRNNTDYLSESTADFQKITKGKTQRSIWSSLASFFWGLGVHNAELERPNPPVIAGSMPGTWPTTPLPESEQNFSSPMYEYKDIQVDYVSRHETLPPIPSENGAGFPSTSADDAQENAAGEAIHKADVIIEATQTNEEYYIDGEETLWDNIGGWSTSVTDGDNDFEFLYDEDENEDEENEDEENKDEDDEWKDEDEDGDKDVENEDEDDAK